jgi:predicted Rossmann fold nucleotide-binding protein DprA/Smf involved in DNA uptake
MKSIKTQLKTISKSLASLSKQVDRITKQVDKLQPAKKAAPARRKKAVRKAAVRKKAAPAKGSTVLDRVYAVIKRSKNGATIATLKSKTGLDSRQLSNALYKLSKKNLVHAKSRGLYVKT